MGETLLIGMKAPTYVFGLAQHVHLMMCAHSCVLAFSVPARTGLDAGHARPRRRWDS
jgi:hypothetical protein